MQRFRHYHIFAFFSALWLASTAAAGTLAMSSFSSGVEGWDSYSFLDNGQPDFTRAFGGSTAVTYNAGVISAQDPDEGWQYFRSGPAFAGNQLAALGGSFIYDIARLDHFVADPINNPEAPAVALAGGNLVLVYTGNVPVPTATFTTDTIPLLANGLWKVSNSSGASATQAQFAAALSNLTGLYILGDWYFGAGPGNGDIYGIANVSLQAGPASPTPEPGTGLVLGAALWALAHVRRKRERLRISGRV